MTPPPPEEIPVTYVAREFDGTRIGPRLVCSWIADAAAAKTALYEGITWIRGWVDENSAEAKALLVAYELIFRERLG